LIDIGFPVGFQRIRGNQVMDGFRILDDYGEIPANQLETKICQGLKPCKSINA
jgi:hypothetical protein